MYVPSEPTSAAVLEHFRRAGLSALSPLQQRLIPLVLQGRSVAVETGPDGGAMAAAIYTLIIGYRGARAAGGRGAASPRAVLIASGVEEVRQATREWAQFARALGHAPAFASVGDSEDARRESRRLGDDAAVIVGTVGRLIDHLRRGSLLLGEMETLFISVPDPAEREVFVRDVQFMLEKSPARRQTILLAGPPLAEQQALLALAHRPQLIQAHELAVAAPPRSWVALDGGDKAEALLRLLIARPMVPVLALHSGRTSAEKVARRLTDLGLRCGWVLSGPATQARRRLVAAFEAGELDVLLAALPLAEEIDPARAATVVWLDLPQARDLKRAVAPRSRLIALVSAGQERDLARLEEAMGSSLTREELPAADEVMGGVIDRLVGRMAAADPGELARLAAAVRRRVPFLKRTQFAAFLLRSQVPALRPSAAAAAPAAAAGGRAAAAPATAPRPREPAPRPREAAQRQAAAGQPRPRPRGAAAEAGGSLYTQLFVSAGRNRRVHARDLVQLFRDRLALPEGRLGAVRVFDKYSFVEVPADLVADAVSKLNGQEFAGRPLTVEVAKRHEVDQRA